MALDLQLMEIRKLMRFGWRWTILLFTESHQLKTVWNRTLAWIMVKVLDVSIDKLFGCLTFYKKPLIQCLKWLLQFLFMVLRETQHSEAILSWQTSLLEISIVYWLFVVTSKLFSISIMKHLTINQEPSLLTLYLIMFIKTQLLTCILPHGNGQTLMTVVIGHAQHLITLSSLSQTPKSLEMCSQLH